MKTVRLHILAGVLAAVAAPAIQAQEASRSGYFLEGYNFRHQLNPAFAPERNYVSVPALGNLGVGAMSNVGVNTFLYKMPDGRLTTFMNSAVGADEFLGKLKNHNKITADVNLTLLSGGFRAFGGYNSVALSVRSEVGVNLPKDLFTFMKVGQTGPDTRYDFGDLRLKARAYAELAFGHQRRITDDLSAGARVKFLLGAGSADARIKSMSVAMGYDKWQVSADGQLDLAAGSGLKVPTNLESGKHLDKPAMNDQIDYDGIDYDSFGLSGFGLGFDLGATCDMHRLLPGLTLSAALTDIGFISWNHNVSAVTPGSTWTFDGFQNIALDSDQPGYEHNKLSRQFDDMWDDMKDCINFERKDIDGTRATALNATFTLGAEYEMPFYRKLSGGFLFTHRFAGCFSWTEGRFSANCRPLPWMGLAVNYAASTFGSSMGWMIDFHPRGFTFFIGSDHQFFRITPQVFPVGKASMNINVGMSVTFGPKA